MNKELSDTKTNSPAGPIPGFRHFLADLPAGLLLFLLALALAGPGGAADPQAAPNLGLPIRCEPLRDCWVVNLVDLDPGPGVRDYACGTHTYDGHKGTDIASLDPQTGQLTPLYHPRRDRWTDHFRLAEAHIVPLTAVGRVTVWLLQLNQPERVAERELLLAAGALRLPE